MRLRMRHWLALCTMLILVSCGSPGSGVATTTTVGLEQTKEVPAATPTVQVATPVPTEEAVPTIVSPPTPSPSIEATPAPVETSTPIRTPAIALSETAVASTTSVAATESSTEVAQLDLSGKLLFVRGGDTWLYRPRTGEARKLIEGTTDARWAPDGTKIASAQGDGLYIVGSDGTNAQRVYEGTDISAPRWAPDGSRLTFLRGALSADADTREVWVYDVTEKTVQKVAHGFDAAWAPDSKRIAYVTMVPMEGVRRNELHLVNWQGQNDWMVVHDLPKGLPSIGIPDSQVPPSDLEHILSHPFWSGDGRAIFAPSYVLYQALTGFSVWERADAQNGGSTFLGELPEVMDATPSPDHKAVLFTSSSARGDTWFVARAIDGDDASWQWAETPKGMGDNSPAWAPDGQAVAYYRCELEQPDRCNLRVLTPSGDALMVGMASESASLDRAMTLDWSKDE